LLGLVEVNKVVVGVSLVDSLFNLWEEAIQLSELVHLTLVGHLDGHLANSASEIGFSEVGVDFGGDSSDERGYK
jgi:hypothetical protein